MPELRAHQLSTAIGSVMLGVFICVLIRFWSPESSSQAISIGLIWVVLTVVFEFGMGRLLMHRPWTQLFHDYDLAAGRVWPLFLIWIGIAPFIFYKLH